ncbi:MAG: FtsX-like permease family protein [Clostridiales bacterium]|jgi:putative ABC transport system permease protein|nr:FtsX-like permease family protein [Clostridiales bacterium]
MPTLLKKALRDVRQRLGAYLACAMLMAIGVLFYGAMTQVAANMPVAMQAFYSEYRFADAFATLHALPASRLKRLTAVEGVEAVSGRLTATAKVLGDTREDTTGLRLISYDPAEQNRLNDVLITEGLPLNAGSYAMLLTEGFYRANGLTPGNTLTLAFRGRKLSFTVAGAVQTPEYIYITPEGSIMPDNKNFGVAYVPLDILEGLLNAGGARNDVSIRFKPGYTFRQLERSLIDALSPGGLTRLYAREDQASHSMLRLELQGIETMVSVLPVLFLLLGAMVMSVVIKRMVEQQHAQIGLMKAFGYSGRAILRHYAVYGILVGLMASIMGGVLGALTAGYIADMYASYFVMPGISGTFSFARVAQLSLLALAFGAGASLYGARGVLRRTAAMAMRPATPEGGNKPILLERLQPLWRRFSATAKLSLRNLFRSRSRSLLTWLGLSICYALTAAVFAFSPMIEYMMQENFTEVQRYDYRIGLVNIADTRQLEQTLLSMRPVALAEAIAELPLQLRAGAISKDTALLALPEDATLYRLFDDARQPVALPRAGVVLTYRMARELGVAVGDTLLLDISYPDTEVPAVVGALCEQYTSSYVLCNRSYLSSLLHGRQFATGAMIKLAPHATGAETERLAQRLNEAENVASVADVAQMQQNMHELIQTSMGTLYAMAVMAIFACFAIVYNAGVVILSERTRELASMRVLGFTLNETSRVVAFEQLALIAAGILLGLPFTGATMEALANSMASDTYAIPADVPFSSHITSVLAMFGAWLAALLVMRRKVAKTKMADVLKGQD